MEKYTETKVSLTEDEESEDEEFEDEEFEVEEVEFNLGLPELPVLPRFPKPEMPTDKRNLQLEFEVKDEFKPVFKAVLPLMKYFREKFICYDDRLNIINGLVTSINLDTKKINLAEVRKLVPELEIRLGEEKMTLKALRKLGIPTEYLETTCENTCYFDRERLNREFLDCFQESDLQALRDIPIQTWKKLTNNYISGLMEVVNVRKDPHQEDGNENVYCTISFEISRPIKPLWRMVGQFIGTFINPFPSKPIHAEYIVDRGGLERTEELIATLSNKTISIEGFECLKEEQYFSNQKTYIPDEVSFDLQDINQSYLVDLTLELNPELNESAEILVNYLAFKRKKQYVSMRSEISALIDMLKFETDVTCSYINTELGYQFNEYITESEMDEFAETLPIHLKEKVNKAYSENSFKISGADCLGLYENLSDMLGFIKDIEKFEFRFVHAPFKTDDPNEPERVEQVFIDFKAIFIGTNEGDLKKCYKEIEDNVKSIEYDIKAEKSS